MQLSVNKAAPKWSLRPRLKPKDGASTAPGPGAYNFTATSMDKYRTSQRYGFGTSSRDGKSFVGVPGPGAYTPFDPNITAPRWVMGSESRLGMVRRSQTPGPGTYDTRGNMDGLQKSMSGRFESKRSHSNPGPGKYNPFHAQTEDAEPRWAFGTSSRPELLGTSKSPGPGTYEALSTLSGNPVISNCPKYTLKPRRNPLKSADTPGPKFGPYTQFT